MQGRKKEEGRRKGRRKKEEGRRKKEEGRRKKEEGNFVYLPSFQLTTNNYQLPTTN